MARSVIDASVVVAYLLDELRPRWIDEMISDVIADRAELLAPSLLWLEIGNRLARSRIVGDEFALEAMLRAEALRIETVAFGRPLRLRALYLARANGLSMYDAAYLAVAEAVDAPLLTLDRRLERAARSMGRSRSDEDGASGVSEPGTPYGAGPADATSLAAIGAAIAEMRREYST